MSKDPFSLNKFDGEIPLDWYGSESLKLTPNLRDSFPEIIGRSRVMTETLELVNKIAKSESSVLVYGESGTGKELIASAIHRISPRSSKRFVPINCSAIPENLLESELFGHEKGAFTGAIMRRQGILEIAKGGTILLDEIGDMPLRLQAKILRVLQEKQYSPVGSNDLKQTDVRIIAATNVDLQKAVADGSFRLDLYYRLSVLPVHIAPLRQRPDDIEPLLHHFLDIANSKHNVTSPCYFSSDVVDALSAHPWPGNVRELQNLVERLVVITGAGPMTMKNLPSDYRHPSAERYGQRVQAEKPNLPPIPTARVVAQPEQVDDWQSLPVQDLPMAGINLTEYIENLENQYIMLALEKTNHNKNQAAKLLGLNRTTLVERIKKRNLAPLNLPSKEL